MMRLVLFAALISLLSISCRNVQHLARVDNVNMVTGAETHPYEDEDMLALILPYRKAMDSTMGEVIGFTAEEIRRSQPDGPLNRMVADIIHNTAEASVDRPVSFAVQNYFGLRIDALPEGQLTLGLIYELMPFDNYLVVLRISGTTVKEFADLIASLGGWPVSHGIEFGIEEDRAVDIMINGKPLNLSESYTLATNDYLANGGDNAFFLTEYQQHNTGILIRDALINYIVDSTAEGNNIGEDISGQRIYLRD
ncbi:MAG: hypothetical protein EA409_09960 [Saprospirales bacterium]|nr:MAG: hypothetical protein EA409_09960 [Saprospirales bacterium]